MSEEILRVGVNSYVLRPCWEIRFGGVLIGAAGVLLTAWTALNDGPPVGRVIGCFIGAYLTLGGVSMRISKLRVDVDGLRDVRWFGVRYITWGRVVAIDLHSERWWQRTLDGAAPHSAQVVIQPGRLLKSYALRSRWEEVARRKHQILSEYLEQSRAHRGRPT